MEQFRVRTAGNYFASIEVLYSQLLMFFYTNATLLQNMKAALTDARNSAESLLTS